jgi:hypothetical protein
MISPLIVTIGRFVWYLGIFKILLFEHILDNQEAHLTNSISFWITFPIPLPEQQKQYRKVSSFQPSQPRFTPASSLSQSVCKTSA